MRGRPAAAVIAAALAGCGGDDAAGPAPKDDGGRGAAATVKAYFVAVSQRDAHGACEQLAQAAQQRVRQATGAEECENGLALAFRDVPQEIVAGLADAKIAPIGGDADSATVRVTGGSEFSSGGREQTVPVTREGDRWLIAEFPNGPTQPDAVATCVKAGIDAFERGEADPFWKTEGRADLVYFLKRLCKRSEKAGAAAESRESREIAARVLQDMIHSGRIDPP